MTTGNQWMEYFPDFMTPLGMLFYSFIVYILVTIHSVTRRRTVQKYVDKTLHANIQKSVLENRKRRSQEAERMLNGLNKYT